MEKEISRILTGESVKNVVKNEGLNNDNHDFHKTTFSAQSAK